MNIIRPRWNVPKQSGCILIAGQPGRSSRTSWPVSGPITRAQKAQVAARCASIGMTGTSSRVARSLIRLSMACASAFGVVAEGEWGAPPLFGGARWPPRRRRAAECGCRQSLPAPPIWRREDHVTSSVEAGFPASSHRHRERVSQLPGAKRSPYAPHHRHCRSPLPSFARLERRVEWARAYGKDGLLASSRPYNL